MIMKRIFLENAKEKYECLIIISTILIFFFIQVPDYKISDNRFGQDNNENEDDGRQAKYGASGHYSSLAFSALKRFGTMSTV